MIIYFLDTTANQYRSHKIEAKICNIYAITRKHFNGFHLGDHGRNPEKDPDTGQYQNDAPDQLLVHDVFTIASGLMPRYTQQQRLRRKPLDCYLVSIVLTESQPVKPFIGCTGNPLPIKNPLN